MIIIYIYIYALNIAIVLDLLLIMFMLHIKLVFLIFKVNWNNINIKHQVKHITLLWATKQIIIITYQMMINQVLYFFHTTL